MKSAKIRWASNFTLQRTKGSRRSPWPLSVPVRQQRGVIEVLTDPGRAALTRAIEANLTDSHVFLSQWPEISLHRDRDRIWTLSQRRFSLCNVVLEARFDPPDVDAQIQRALMPYETANVNVMWKLGPSTQPVDLAARLMEQGFIARPTLRGMAMELTSLGLAAMLQKELEIREVIDSESLDLWQQAVDRGFGWPAYGASDLADNLGYFFKAGGERPFVPYVGLIKGEPIASSLVFFAAGVAGIYHVSTVPEQRGRGVGLAITRAPLIEARRRGYRIAILHATEMGFPVYRRLGFQEVCAIQMRLRL